MDTLKAQIAHNNDGMLSTYRSSEQSFRVMARNGVRIEGNTVTQNGEPLFAIHRRHSAKKTQGCYRELTPTLEYIRQEKKQEKEVTHFITGMALGIDVYAAEIVLDLKTKYPYITLESAIPCETQAVKWSVAARERYYNIAAKCDKETMLQREYTPGCMEKRNQYMVDHADYILAVWNGRPSGTGNTVRYAQKKGKFVIVIDPVSLDVKRE